MQILRRMAHWKFPLAIAAICGVIALMGEDSRYLLQYARADIAAGEFWRLASGHFVHLGHQHLLLNLLGLLLVWLLVGRAYNTRSWLLVTLICLLVMDAGFWLFDPELRWYVGLSGLLHGLLLAGALGSFRQLPAESLAILALMTAKLIYEQFSGPLPGSEAVAGGTVIVNAHLYGALGGMLAGFALWRSVRPIASI
jgi:rhomboid family GlyGly-CTERM serine protease